MQFREIPTGFTQRSVHQASVSANRFLPIIFLTFFGLGCPKRIDFGPTGEIKDAAELLKLTGEAEGLIASVRGDSQVRVSSPQGSGALTVFVAVSRPALVHLEALNFFGKPQSILVSDGRAFGLYQPDEGKYYRGPASPRNLSRFLPLVLPIPDLVSLMLGEVGRIAGGTATLTLDADSGWYLVTLSRGSVVQKLWIDPATRRVRKSSLKGGRDYDVQFDDFETAGATVFPRELKLSAESASTQLALRYTDIALNEPMDPGLFRMEPPAGVSVIDLDESGNPAGSISPPRESIPDRRRSPGQEP